LGRTKQKKVSDQSPPQSIVKREIKGIVCLFLGIIIAGSLISHYSTDPLIFDFHSQSGRIKNIFGISGAWLSHILLLQLGISSFVLSIIFTVAGLGYFIKDSFTLWSKKIFILILLVISISGLASLIYPEPVLYHGGKLSSGGKVGIFISGLLVEVINRQGAYLVLLSIIIISLMIITRISLGTLFSGIWLFLSGVIRAINEYRIKKRERKRKRMVRKRYIEEQKTRPREKISIVIPGPGFLFFNVSLPDHSLSFSFPFFNPIFIYCPDNP